MTRRKPRPRIDVVLIETSGLLPFGSSLILVFPAMGGLRRVTIPSGLTRWAFHKVTLVRRLSLGVMHIAAIGSDTGHAGVRWRIAGRETICDRFVKLTLILVLTFGHC
jgi:hypothetical protein